MRILIAGFLHETNTFAQRPADYENFVNGEGFPALRRGEELFELAAVNIPLGGFIKAMDERSHELIPVLWCAASPSAPVTSRAFELLVGEITQGCRDHAPDAVYLDLHGAMVTDDYDDAEGEVLRRVRSIVGPDVPIVVSLDLHANMSSTMFEIADAMTAYRTYPHVDMAETGKRSVELLERLHRGEELHCAWRRIPFLIPINAGSTNLEPARGIYATLDGPLTDGYDLSFGAGFPAADIPDCSPVVWGYGPDAQRLDAFVDELAARVARHEGDFVPELLSPDGAMQRASELLASGTRPIVIADTQDNPGAGGEATTTGMLRSLLKHNIAKSVLGAICDPTVAAHAHEVGVGATMTARFPGSPYSGDAPLEHEFTVAELSDGYCRFDGPMMHGNELHLGPSALLLSREVGVVVTTRKAQIMDRNQFAMVGVSPEAQNVVVVKSSVHFRGDFQPIAGAVLVAQAPGPMAANPADLSWTRLAEGVRVGPLGQEFHRSVELSGS
ncbi:M81 family metallopeptidase [Saxibacter everestensis]|uniref:M81 family metallopeptidase n=1 Tax=Saxibacter everestensis TaxID=2909229 RepID=A0ABY8QTF1_9MICO|nr:M81 family metallopeptidase [Brevibacteriaceae bacterium ZFBP1038]